MAKENKETKGVTIATLYKDLISQVKASGLELREEKKKSRITFHNSRRVLSLEPRKRYVLVHLPKIETLEKSDAVSILSKADEDFRAKISSFSMSIDARGYTYIRVSAAKEMEDFGTVLKIANEFNR